MDLTPFRKALVPAGVAAVLAVLALFNVTPDMTVKETATLLVSCVLVYLIPNNNNPQ